MVKLNNLVLVCLRISTVPQRLMFRIIAVGITVCLFSARSWSAPIDFDDAVLPILQAHCFECHGAALQEGGLRLDVRDLAIKDSNISAVIVPGNANESELVRRVESTLKDKMMPPKGERLSAEEIKVIRKWINDGAKWSNADSGTSAQRDPRLNHWAWQPLNRPTVPQTVRVEWPRNEIDCFILAALEQRRLSPSPEADRRTLIRRLSFDLLGLPPSVQEIAAFVDDRDPTAYEKLVDRYLQSPHYGERWARHWLDVVHYGDTHGYDKDKPRPNAWPYRDYVIRALNEDKPYARFVQEQVAGDVLFPGTRDGIVALGFIAAGPWDFIGHAEVAESKIDGMIARHLDRDDMVSSTLGTFCSVTIGCAQCHNHKFDPFTQEDYYSLQAVFAAVDRADRKYFVDVQLSQKYHELESRRRSLLEQQKKLESLIQKRAGDELVKLDTEIDLLAKAKREPSQPEYGYHSELSSQPESVKWVQVDLGESLVIEKVVLRPCSDDFNNIGDGFGFPVRFKIELCDDVDFRSGVTTIVSHFDADFANPGLSPQEFAAQRVPGRFVRVTAIKLAHRKNDFMLAIAELQAIDDSGLNRAAGATVTALDSIEAPPRWQKRNLVDRVFPSADASTQLPELRARRESLRKAAMDPGMLNQHAEIQASLAATVESLKKFPPPEVAYIGAVYTGSGAFAGTGATGGKPRPINLLSRGSVLNPGKPSRPGAIQAFEYMLSGRFDLPTDHSESDRRAALAGWLSDERNSLTWRSIVNRVWQYHFGGGLVETANDFGRMGALPTHPDLLDWLATEFRDGGASLKNLHRLIVESATYRQSSTASDPAGSLIDIDNRYLWRHNRRKLDAESVRDAVFATSDKLDLTMGGPGYQDFVIEQEAHSPHYQYHLADPLNTKTWRRSVYRFIVRSQTHPFMTSLDCADPSMRVEKRNESISASQALALLNNGVMVTQAGLFADRVRQASGDDVEQQIQTAFLLALGRNPTEDERLTLSGYLRNHGLANLCRVMFNLNEFLFID